MNRALPLIAVMALSSLAMSQQPNVGVRVGVFFPSSSAIKTALGDTWLSYGFNFGTIEGIDGRKMGGDTFFVTRNARGNRLFLGTLSYGVTIPLGTYNRTTQFRPFFAVRGGLSYADYRIGAVGGSNIIFNANAELGVNLTENFQVSLRYDLNTRTRGFDLSGGSLSARYNLLSF